MRIELSLLVAFASIAIWPCCTSSSAPAAEPPVTALAFAPDGKSVVVGSQNGLYLHRWPDLTRLAKLNTVIDTIHDVSFSAGGEMLAVAGGTPSEVGQVELLTWPESESIRKYDGHSDSVHAVVWLSDTAFASASLDHSVKVWDVGQQNATRELHGHSRGVTTLAFLAGDKLLVSGSLDNSLRVWDLGSGEIVRTLNNHTAAVQRIRLGPSQTGLAMMASISDDNTLRLWQPTIGRLVRFLRLESPPLDIAYQLDGSIIAVASEDGHVRLIDAKTLQATMDVAVADGWAYSVIIHPTDGSFLVGAQDGQLKRVLGPSQTP